VSLNSSEVVESLLMPSEKWTSPGVTQCGEIWFSLLSTCLDSAKYYKISNAMFCFTFTCTIREALRRLNSKPPTSHQTFIDTWSQLLGASQRLEGRCMPRTCQVGQGKLQSQQICGTMEVCSSPSSKLGLQIMGTRWVSRHSVVY